MNEKTTLFTKTYWSAISSEKSINNISFESFTRSEKTKLAENISCLTKAHIGIQALKTTNSWLRTRNSNS